MASKRASDKKSADAVAPVTTDATAPVVVTLPADCRIAAQAALKAELQGALGAAAIVLDGRAVERIDTAALQLLVLFQRELAARGNALRWSGTSEALDEAAALLGLTQMVQLPAAGPA
jgi:phospholipid transport system transporter-binding protein